MAEATESLVHFKINDRELSAKPGTTIIQAAHAAGFEVPFFCYHPGLAPEGNCRMCLVEVKNARKPVASCVTPVTEGMEVLTESDQARDAREGVLELMLVNHPLDCPICDKSGECILQDNTYNHGPDGSRMVEPKELKPTKDLGSKIALWGNRCISCTRCVRFCHEVSGSGELTIVNRGDHSYADVFEDYPLENPLAMNTVDICPVGALISKDFLYEARVWYLQKQNSICAGCARGCNIEVQTIRNEVKRLMPRHNAEVNDYWMCDQGRFGFDHVGNTDRLYRYRLPRGGGAESTHSTKPADAAPAIVGELGRVIDEHGPASAAALASAFMTLEELALFRELCEALGITKTGAVTRPSVDDEVFPRFRISGDKNPNRAGVRAILGDGACDGDLQAVKQGIRDGAIRALLLVWDLPDQPLDGEWIELLERLDAAIVLTISESAAVPGDACRIPATTFAEKSGAMINEDGRVQRLVAAVQPPRTVRTEIELFQEALRSLGAWELSLSADGVFRKLVGKYVPELEGVSHRDIGELGGKLDELARQEVNA